MTVSLFGSSSFLCFFLKLVDDGKPEGSSSFLCFFFWCRRRRQTKQVRRHLLHFSKKIIVKNKQITRKVDVHLLATDTLVFLEERFLQHHFSNVFCNIASASATLTSAAALQHCFCSTIFCNITFVVE